MQDKCNFNLIAEELHGSEVNSTKQPGMNGLKHTVSKFQEQRKQRLVATTRFPNQSSLLSEAKQGLKKKKKIKILSATENHKSRNEDKPNGSKHILWGKPGSGKRKPPIVHQSKIFDEV
jgi:hypothetical protein